MTHSKLIYIAGPTASGKTTAAIALAQALNTEIISCDARQFYREMKIGTAVPSPEELQLIPHHFIQQRSIHEPYTVGDYREEALAMLRTLFKKHDTLILVGGSGMFADALIDGMDVFPTVDPMVRPQLNAIYQQEGIEVLQDLLRQHDLAHYQRVDRQNPQRLIRALEVSLSAGQPYSSFLGKKVAPDFFTTEKIVLEWDRPTLYARINERVDQMIAQGLEEEARGLMEHRALNALQTVGYREWFAHFDGSFDRETAIEEIKKNSRRYAKRQITWFRRYKKAHRIECGASVKTLISALKL